MAIPFDWDAIREKFVSGTMRLRSLSREETNDPNSPKYQSLGNRSRRENWPALRKARQEVSAFVESDLVQIEAALARPIGYELAHYSSDLPEDLKEGYSQAIGDPNLMAMMPDIATLTTLIASCLRRMNNSEPSIKHYQRLRKTANEWVAANRSKDVETGYLKSNQLMRLIADGCPQVELQDELVRLIRTRADLIASEGQRLKLLQQYITIAEVESWFEDILEAVKFEVNDSSKVARIRQRIAEVRKLRS